MEKIRLDLVSLASSKIQHNTYTLKFREAGGRRIIKVAIGTFEAQAIALEIESMTPPRPMTHDLFKSLARSFNIDLIEVIIYDFREGIFYANLVCSDGVEIKEIDSRTSDAFALAVRFKCPIYTYGFILDQVGIVGDNNIDQEDDDEDESENADFQPTQKTELKPSKPVSGTSEFSTYSEEELNQSLKRAIDDEEYELASRIRDELNKRKPI